MLDDIPHVLHGQSTRGLRSGRDRGAVGRAVSSWDAVSCGHCARYPADPLYMSAILCTRMCVSSTPVGRLCQIVPHLPVGLRSHMDYR